MGALPYGELVHTGTAQAIAAKGATDTNVITVTGTLPRGFVYRPIEGRFLMSGVDSADFADTEPATRILWTENQVTRKDTIFYNQAAPILPQSQVEGFAVANPAITNDFSATFLPPSNDKIWNDVIDASQGVSIFQATFVNRSGNASAAMSLSTYFRYFMYTIAQYRNAAMWEKAI